MRLQGATLVEPDVSLSTHPAPIIRPTVSGQTPSNVEITMAAYGLPALANSGLVLDAP